MFNFKITADVREYFNYRHDDASFRLEEAKLNGLRVPTQRDFRTREQWQEDNGAGTSDPLKVSLSQGGPKGYKR
jgi:hypothetical protein